MLRFPAGIDATSFLRDYWQQRPLLMPGGLPELQCPLTPDELAGLALEEEVESRLVLGADRNGPRELHHGPFSEERLTALPPDSPWTLLVQAVDLWVPEAAAILEEFSFLPRWRMEDLMVSFASDGGGVGPHFDYYDVFLIQATGRREWRIGEHCDGDTPLLANSPLRILRDFEPTETMVLEPGDVLYLPPGIAHHGVALGECMTLSVGFRAPTAGEMLDDLATEVLSRGGGDYYRDPPLTPAMASERIDPAFIKQVRKLLLATLDDETLLGEWFAAYMTTPRYPELTPPETSVPRRARLPRRGDAADLYFVDGHREEH